MNNIQNIGDIIIHFPWKKSSGHITDKIIDQFLKTF